MAESLPNVQEADSPQTFEEMVVSNIKKAEDKLKDGFLRKLRKAIEDEKLKLSPDNVKIYFEGMYR